MADVVYVSPYPAGWQDLPATATPINHGALQQMDNGIAAAVGQANAAARLAAGAVPGQYPTDGATAKPTYFTGQSFQRWSHSFGFIPGVMCTPGKEWPNQLKTLLGTTGSFDGNGTYGASTMDGSYYICGSVTGKGPTIPLSGLVILEYAGADYRFLGNPPSASQLTSVQHSLRSMLAMLSSQSVVQSTAAWSSGDATASFNGCYGGTVHYTGTSNATLTLTIDGTKCVGGVCYLLMFVESGNTRTLTTTVDGTANASFNKTNQFVGYPSQTGSPDNFGTILSGKGVIRLTGIPTTGTHTVVVNSGTGSGNASIEAVIYPSPTPPTIAVLKDPKFNTADAATVAAAKPCLDPVYDSVCAEFTSAFALDLNTGGWWDPDLHLGSDRNHPNDVGMAAITNRISQVLKARGF